MDSSEMSWLAEMGVDSSIFIDQCDFMDSLDEEMAAMLGQANFDNCLSFSAGNNSPPTSTLINIPNTNSSINSLPSEPQNPNNYSNFSTPNSTTPVILNFGITAENPQQVLNPDEEATVSEVLRSQGAPEEQDKRLQPAAKKPSRVRPPSQTYDHIIAERKRREQLSQRFVTLSTIVPGLKKMDKTSVLGDAIKYLKHLQERVKTLEEQSTRHTIESVVLVKKSRVMAEDEGSSDEKSGCPDGQSLPEIEARVCKNHMLVRVHCQNQRGILVNVLGKVESLNLTVINTNVTPFGNLTLDITIVAEVLYQIRGPQHHFIHTQQRGCIWISDPGIFQALLENSP